MTRGQRLATARVACAVVSFAAARPALAQGRTVPPPAVDDSVSRPFIPGGHWSGNAAAAPAPPTFAAVPAQPLSADGVPFFARPNGGLLRPGTFVYRLALRRDTTTMPLGIRQVTVSETMMGGVPSWLIAESRTGTAVETSDSLYLNRADLSPGRWGARNGRSQLAASFTPDSMFAAIQDYQGRGSFSAPVPPGTLLSAGMIDRVVELLPLAAGYRAAASVMQIEAGTPRALLAELAVTGEERLAAADRSVDCWVVLLRAGSLEKRYWVSKEAPRVMKTEQATSGGLLTEIAEP